MHFAHEQRAQVVWNPAREILAQRSVIPVEEHRNEIPINRLWEIMDISPRGYWAWRNRPPRHSQRKDMVVLGHIREKFALSLGAMAARA